MTPQHCAKGYVIAETPPKVITDHSIYLTLTIAAVYIKSKSCYYTTFIFCAMIAMLKVATTVSTGEDFH